MKVGDTIWYFDVNRRVYPPKGSVSTACIYREHWRPVEIKSETSRSWITLYGKAPKKGGRGWVFTEQEIDGDVWREHHAWKVGRMVERCRDAEKLKRVAEIVGYKEGGGE